MIGLPPAEYSVTEFPHPRTQFPDVRLLIETLRRGYLLAYLSRIEGRDYVLTNEIGKDGKSGSVAAHTRDKMGEVNEWGHEIIEFVDLTPTRRKVVKIPTAAEWIV